MNWLFYLDDILIDEPVGFADITLRIKRDEQWHGIFFEATTNDLKFYGDAADYLMGKKGNEGFSAEVIFKAVVDCGEPDEIFEGKLDFRQYKEQCGGVCFVTIPVEQTGCTMTLRNRYDQKVDISDNIAFDKQTILPNYDGLNFAMELAAQELKVSADASVASGNDVVTLDYPFPNAFQADIMVRPTYGTVRDNSIDTGQLDSVVNNFEFTDDQQTPHISPQLLFEEAANCFPNEFVYNIRLKGSYHLDTTIGGQTDYLSNKLILWHGVGSIIDDGVLVDEDILPVAGPLPNFPANGTFDSLFTGTIVIPEGWGLYAFFFSHVATQFDDGETDFVITFEPETIFTVQANKSCPPTDAVVSLIHETASRITEAITDHCLTVKSDYYGRTDSEPYAAAADGCGSLRVLSNGLRIRNADTQNHFLSLKELFESLNPIDNIGMGIEPTGVYDIAVLRIEPVEYFYQDTEIIRHPNIPSAEKPTLPEQAYSIVKVGYKKWETENVNGLDEFNSNKEFRTSLKSINNTLDITSGFIAGGYPIEHTRQQSFAETGAADTKYDNDTFIICVTRAPYAYGNYAVEQGNIGNAANIYSPATAYNWRIRPMYNLIRWWKSIAQSYVNLVNTASKLLFSSGTGNLLAEGELAVYDPCKVDATLLAENDDLARSDILVGQDPIWKPDGMTYRYPMSLRDYNTIKTNPLGYIAAQCGSGEFEKGFIVNINYRIAKGDADITLRQKWV